MPTEDSSTKPKPYEPRHVPLVPCFEVTENRDGVRYYQYPTEGPDKTRKFFDTNLRDQKYFYRAMLESEADGWMAIAQSPVELRLGKYLDDTRLQIEGHQGWASYRAYSEKYLKDKSNNYTFIIEVFAPNFISQLMEIGVKAGKIESLGEGDISWGMGQTNSNGFGGSSETNSLLKKRYNDFRDAITAAGKKNIDEFSSNNMKKMCNTITPFIFAETIRWAKKIDLRSVPPKKK